MQFRVKWKGYELDPDEWTLEDSLEECAALDEWQVPEALLPALFSSSGMAVPSCTRCGFAKDAGQTRRHIARSRNWGADEALLMALGSSFPLGARRPKSYTADPLDTSSCRSSLTTHQA